jgi:hypothetical protein
MHVLATRDIEEWSGPIDVGTWSMQAFGKWAWLSDVLGGLLALAQARYEYYKIHIGRNTNYMRVLHTQSIASYTCFFQYRLFFS